MGWTRNLAYWVEVQVDVTGHTGLIVGFVVHWLINNKQTKFLTSESL